MKEFSVTVGTKGIVLNKDGVYRTVRLSRAGRSLSRLALVLLPALIALFAGAQGGASPALAATDQVVYGDALAAGWQNWSWSANVNFANASPVLGGAGKSVAVTLNAAWAGLSLRASSPVATGGYAAVRFWVYGAANGNALKAYIQASDSGAASPAFEFSAPAGVWTPITVTLAALGNPAQIQRINIQDRAGTAQPTFFVDDIRLVGTSSAAATPTPLPTPVPPTPTPPAATNKTIRIDGAAAGAPLEPRLLGSNLPAWLGRGTLADPVFRARAAATGIRILRLPGGSWSDEYGWLSCELDANQPGAMPCPALGWGARPSDFIGMVRAAHAEALWVVNVNGTSKEAAAAVAFFNARTTDTTPIGVDVRGTDWKTAGHWAALRAAHGYPEPLGIRYWEFGNEVYGGKPGAGALNCQSWGWETSWTCDGTEYVNGNGSGAGRHEGYSEFRAAMRAVDPNVQLGASGMTDLNSYANWSNKVIAAAGSVLDFFVVHPYAYDTPPPNSAAGWAQVLAMPQTHWGSVRAALQPGFDAHAAARPAPLAATEYNIVSAWTGDNAQMMLRAGNALYTADSIGQLAQNGYRLAMQWDLANGAASNGTDYGLLKQDTGFTRNPAYYAFVLWSGFGSALVPVASNANAASELSVYAGRVNSTTVTLLAINKTNAPLAATITVSGTGALIGGTASVVSASGPDALAVNFNGKANPASDLSDAPAAPINIGTGSSFGYTFAPTSVTLLTLRTGTPDCQVYLPAVSQ